MQTLIDLETQGWHALSTGGEASKQFYSSVLRDDAVMLFPGGIRLDGKENILQSLAAQPWKSFQIEAPQVISLSETVGVLVYQVTAQREGSNPYGALITSTYVLSDGTWKLALHQQTLV
ncbi:nuclear transport factor 2 family protein [Leptolyngbya sp. NK1-12]|uniref:Nuclear transport factor 2 family protein n=1 Tax=Leptolyngbya sp. NK1-12 TaxID=2547451 RepID=A0AA96WJB4_9CYAN|nr:nuclear transport factor 2 family protein [Leptolyngbya sp. NK1-12]WNZ23271.1 nuclear transport factor 2 family protein [Leptolyngbya sp. NK1-12]